MPGIYGLAGELEIKSNLESMERAVLLYKHIISDSLFIADKIGASRVHLGKIGEQSSPFSSSDFLIWIEGEAYNINEVASDFNLSEHSLGELLVSAEKSNQLDDCLNRLDGNFCAALYDTKKRKIKLISDRYGMKVLYWYHHNGVFAWGSEVKSILSIEDINKTLDISSYDCFMELGYLLGESTWFQYIKLIKPATVIEYDLSNDNCVENHYWSWSEIRPTNLNFEDAVNELGVRFINAVSRQFNPKEKIGISLSGGLDSRAILAAVEHLNPHFNGYAFTFGLPKCDDITIAKRVINRAVNWKHNSYYFTADNWYEARIPLIWNTDGMLDMMHMHGSEFSNQIKERIDVNLNGYAGDIILGGGFLPFIPLNERATEENTNYFYRKFSELADINNCLYDIKHVEINLLMNRIRRFTNYGTVNALFFIQQRKPFFDNKLVEFIYSLPDEYRLNNHIYSAMLQKLRV